MASVASFRMAAAAGSSSSLLARLAATTTTATPPSLTSALAPAWLPARTIRFTQLVARRLAAAAPLLPTLPAISLSLPSLPSLLEGIWESILRAVPKKKVSHMKRRHRQMAGKALKDVNSLSKCPACGRTKRMHHLCPYCMETIREMLRKDAV